MSGAQGGGGRLLDAKPVGLLHQMLPQVEVGRPIRSRVHSEAPDNLRPHFITLAADADTTVH